MFCSQCNTTLRDGAKFCTNCGSKQENIPPPPEQSAPQPISLSQWLERFRNSTPDTRLNLLREIVSSSDENFLLTLSTQTADTLFDESMKTLQPPGRSFGDSAPGGFVEAKSSVLSEEKTLQEKGLAFFEQQQKKRNSGPRTIIHEWLLFAQARRHGAEYVVKQWEKKCSEGSASWTEIWNLAVFYIQREDFAQAFKVLQPNIDLSSATFAHLRFALYCALKCLALPLPISDEKTTVIDFLLRHLSWPLAECYLTWLLLKIQATGLETFEQSTLIAWCETLYQIATRPIDIPDFEKRVDEQDVRDFVEYLEQQGLTEFLALWLKQYTQQFCPKLDNSNPNSKLERWDFEIYQKLSDVYERLGTSEQAEHILYRLAREQQKIFLSQGGSNGHPPLKAFPAMRFRLVALFSFYQRQETLSDEKAFTKFVEFYEKIPQAWNESNDYSQELVDLTRPLLAKYDQSIAEKEVALPSVQSEQPSLLDPVQSETKDRPRVGIFVDLENIVRVLRDNRVKNIGEILQKHAAHFGDVVCSWAAADMRNLREDIRFMRQLEYAGFRPRYPYGVTQAGKADKKLADFALIETIHRAMCKDKPDVYLIISGDQDFCECIVTLIESGASVRLCASLSSNHIAERYKELEWKRKYKCAEKNRESDFVIDDLDLILK